jgi:hypothetical protein
VCPAQVNLKLFAPEPNRTKTVLLFVIRDKSKTPMDKIREILIDDLAGIWATMSKPPQYVDSSATDFFEVQVRSGAGWRWQWPTPVAAGLGWGWERRPGRAAEPAGRA